MLRPLIPLNTGDYSTLFPGCMLNAQIVDAHLRLIERRSEYYSELPKVRSFSALDLDNWMRGDFSSVYFDEANVFERDILLFPHMVKDGWSKWHWALVVCRPKDHTVYTYDPLRGTGSEDEPRAVLNYLGKVSEGLGEALNTDVWTIQHAPDDYPRVELDASSGVFICVLIECITVGKPFSKLLVDETAWRKNVSSALRHGRLEKERFFTEEEVVVEEREWRYGRRVEKVGPARLKVTLSTGAVEEVNLMGDPVSFRPYRASGRNPPKFEPVRKPEPRRDPTPPLGPDEESRSPVLSIMADSDIEDLESEEAKVVDTTKSPGPSTCPAQNPKRPQRRRRVRKHFRVRYQREDGTFYRVKFLKDEFKPSRL